MTTGADLLVDELLARGVEFIATLNGHGLDPFYLACRRRGVRMIDVRNEQAASYMAEVTGRLTRRVGVCAVSGAVAHANALTGVLNASFDGAPMLLITGMAPLARLGYGDFQDFNPVPMAAPICKYARILDVPELVPQIVHEAFTAATSGRPGPVHLALPIDIGSAEVEAGAVVRSAERTGAVRLAGGAEPDLIDAALEMFRGARRPLLVAGSGVYYAHGENVLAEFANQQQIPVVVPIWDRGSVTSACETFAGVIGAATGSAGIFEKADLVVLAGVDLDYRVGQLSAPVLDENARVIRIDADSARLRSGVEVGLSIQGSPATVLEQLTDACRRDAMPAASAWWAEAREAREAFRSRCLSVADELGEGLTGRDVVLAVQEVIQDNTVVLVDGGNIGQWFHQLLDKRYPGHWVTCGASGVVGWGLPGAMAARAVDPTRPVILVSGDGSFTFTVAELECAARQGLPFVAIVADDELWGISVTGHVRDYGEPLYSALGPTRLDLVAEGFNCYGVRVTKRAALVESIRTALKADRPTVIHTPILPGSPSGD